MLYKWDPAFTFGRTKRSHVRSGRAHGSIKKRAKHLVLLLGVSYERCTGRALQSRKSRYTFEYAYSLRAVHLIPTGGSEKFIPNMKCPSMRSGETVV